MSGEWVNRMGIILNFCAGFLLAPELIGIQRLQRFEKFLEHRVRNFSGELPERMLGLLAYWLPRQLFFALLPFSLCSLVLWCFFLWITVIVLELSTQVIVAIVVLSVVGPLVATFLDAFMHRNDPVVGLGVIGQIAFPILTIELSFLLIPRMIWGAVRFGLFLVFWRPLSWVLGRGIARLTGNDRLRGIVVTLGIVLFVVGNTLQFLATWF